MARDKASKVTRTNVQQRRQDGSPIPDLTNAGLAALKRFGPARGMPGPPGEDGRRGMPGPPGPKGATGAAGSGSSGSGGILGVLRRFEEEDGRRGFPGPQGPAGLAGSEFTTTATGNIDDLDFQNATLIRFNNAADATLRGLKAGRPGQLVLGVSIGAGHVFCAHQNAGSAVGNRLINSVTSNNTPLAAGFGSFAYQYDGTTARWRLVGHSQGAWITSAYAAGNFTGNVGTWTVDAGDVITALYYLEGKELSVLLQLDTTSCAGTPNQLIVNTAAIGGFTVPSQTYLPLGHVFDAGAFAAADPFVLGTGSFYFTRLDGANFANSANATYCRACATYAVT